METGKTPHLLPASSYCSLGQLPDGSDDFVYLFVSFVFSNLSLCVSTVALVCRQSTGFTSSNQCLSRPCGEQPLFFPPKWQPCEAVGLQTMCPLCSTLNFDLQTVLFFFPFFLIFLFVVLSCFCFQSLSCVRTASSYLYFVVPDWLPPLSMIMLFLFIASTYALLLSSHMLLFLLHTSILFIFTLT